MDEYKQRTPEERELWRVGHQIQAHIRQYIFEQLPQVNAYSYGIKYINSHVELEFGISVDFIREELAVVLHQDDDPCVIREFMQEQLARLYKGMLAKKEAE